MTSQQPTGFRFVPTEKELVVDYLRPKIFKFPLPCDDIIPVKNIYELNPEQLSDSEIGVYFFTLRKKKYRKGSNSDRVVADGRWISKRKRYDISHDGKRVGKKTSLKYMKGKNQDETHWLMDEYELIYKKKEGQLEEDWVICKIHKSKSKSKNHTPLTNGEIPVDEGPSNSRNIVLQVDEGPGSSENVIHQGPPIFPHLYNPQDFNNVWPENISDTPFSDGQATQVDGGLASCENMHGASFFPPLDNSQELANFLQNYDYNCPEIFSNHDYDFSDYQVGCPLLDNVLPENISDYEIGCPLLENVLPENISDDSLWSFRSGYDNLQSSFNSGIIIRRSSSTSCSGLSALRELQMSWRPRSMEACAAAETSVEQGMGMWINEGPGSSGNVVHRGPPISPPSLDHPSFLPWTIPKSWKMFCEIMIKIVPKNLMTSAWSTKELFVWPNWVSFDVAFIKRILYCILLQQVIAEHLSLEEVAGIKKTFEMMDINRNGKITVGELKVGLHKIVHQIPDANVQMLMEAAFCQLLQAPRDDTQMIIRDRFPVPVLVVCDQHGSQAGFPLAKLNPSATYNSAQDVASRSDAIFTDNISLQVFFEHFQRLAVQS